MKTKKLKKSQLQKIRLFVLSGLIISFSLLLFVWTTKFASRGKAIYIPKFRRSFKAQWPHIDRPSSYDYSPSAMQTDKGWEIWTCGNTPQRPGDNIYYTLIGPDGKTTYSTQPVLSRTDKNYTWDGQHACAPIVFKQEHPYIYSGKEIYKMYYECAPKYYDRFSKKQVEGPTAICHAISFDGKKWLKFNRGLWERMFVFSSDPDSATPVIPLPSRVLSLCNTKIENTKTNQKKSISSTPYSNQALNDNYRFLIDSQRCTLPKAYGVGHPSVIVKDFNGEQIGGQQIWLYYYDSSINRVVLRKSWDGFNFDPPIYTNLTFPIEVKYLNDNLYVGITTINNQNQLYYSQDGVIFRKIETIGKVMDNLCVVPAPSTIVSDKFGRIKNYLNILSNEGYLGRADNCLAGRCTCYSSAEDRMRGSTWGIYLMQGYLNLQ